MRWAFILFLILYMNVSAQCVQYILGVRKDTLNCVDKNGKKQGRWVIRYEELRGEPGFEEEGVFKDGKKTGVWRKYTLPGDLLAIENYKWGLKDSVSMYFTMMGLEHEESWKALDPNKLWDTIEVNDPFDPYKIEKKVVKNEGRSLKHGIWNYYNQQSGTITKTEFYVLGQLQTLEDQVKDNTTLLVKDSVHTKKDSVATSTKTKPKEVLEYEKKKGKKKERDGRTGY